MVSFLQIQKAARLLKKRALRASSLLKLSQGAQLSVPMVRWCIRSSIEPWLDLQRSPVIRVSGGQSWLLILSANVLTGGIRPIFLGLLAGHRLHIRLSSRDAGLTSMVIHALWQTVPRLRGRLSYSENDGSCIVGPVIKHPTDGTRFDVVHAFGSDETLRQLRAYYSCARFEGHGTGFGYVYLDAKTLARADLRLWGRNVALDIAAYDQRGCLSPQIVFVQARRQSSAYAKVIDALAEGLNWIENRLPRGPLDIGSLARLYQSGGVAAVTGRWIRGRTWNIYDRPKPLYPSWLGAFPADRSVSVVSVAAVEEVITLLADVNPQVKSVGVSLDHGPVEALRKAFPAARISSVGAMQCPPIDIFWDGRRFE